MGEGKAAGKGGRKGGKEKGREGGKEGRKIDSTAIEEQILAGPSAGPATVRF